MYTGLNENLRSTSHCGSFSSSSLSSSPPHDDFSPTNLQRVTDVLYISLFDEVVIDILQVGGATSSDVGDRIFIVYIVCVCSSII